MRYTDVQRASYLLQGLKHFLLHLFGELPVGHLNDGLSDEYVRHRSSDFIEPLHDVAPLFVQELHLMALLADGWGSSRMPPEVDERGVRESHPIRD